MLPDHGMPTTKPYVFKSRTELAVEAFANLDKPKESDVHKLRVVSQVEEGILELMGYLKAGYEGMSRTQLEEEEHDSQKLGNRMKAAGDNKPNELSHAHAIVSGAHPRAATLRGILAKFKIRIDDPDNGCWLPENTEAKRITASKAVPHRIHRKNYYLWMDSYIKLPVTKDESYCRFQLEMIRDKLLNMELLPDYVMLPAGAGIK